MQSKMKKSWKKWREQVERRRNEKEKNQIKKALAESKITPNTKCKVLHFNKVDYKFEWLDPHQDWNKLTQDPLQIIALKTHKLNNNALLKYPVKLVNPTGHVGRKCFIRKHENNTVEIVETKKT